MTSQFQPHSILLGRGGPQPGLSMYDCDSGRTDPAHNLNTGHSVYAISISLDGSGYAFGTRGGHIFWCRSAPDSPDDEAMSEYKIEQGVSLLSVCLMDATTLAASDKAGRCLVWRYNEPAPRYLKTNNEIICALLRPDQQHLLGLSTSGQLYCWEQGTWQLVSVVEGAPPPKNCAVASLVYWPEAESVLWPCAGGYLGCCNLSTREVTHLRMHDGDFYAVAVLEKSLLTAGRSDGQLKCWRAGSDTPLWVHSVGQGPVSMAAWAGPELRVMIIKESGSVELHTYSEGSLQFDGILPGTDYRSVVGPGAGRIQAMFACKKAAQVEEIAQQITAKIDDQDFEGLEPLHTQLVDLGYRHVSLALRAQQYRADEDIVAELKTYRQLIEYVGADHSVPERSLQRYAHLLEQVWQLDMAQTVHAQLQTTVKPDRIQHIERCVRVLDQGTFVLEPELPVEVILKSAAAFGKIYSGRYLINKLDPDSLRQGQIKAADIIRAYLNQRDTLPGLPEAQSCTLHWMSASAIQEQQLVIIGKADMGSQHCLEFGVTVQSSELVTTFTPVVLFRVSEKAVEMSTEDHSTLVLESYANATDEAVSTPWLQLVHTHLLKAIRKLITARESLLKG